jgi:hypothetical protein
MTEKKVILAKTEFDAMEAELQDLRTIVASRTVLMIVEEKLNWRVAFHVASGTRIKYILGTDSDEANIKSLADHIEHLTIKLEQVEMDRHIEKSRLSDEIKRLTNRKWYQKLFNGIQQIKRIIWHNTEKNQ